MRVQIRIMVEPDGTEFHAYAPALPGLHSSGQTEQEAVANTLELVSVYLASMLKHGDPLPIGCMTGEGAKRPGGRGRQRVECVALA